MLVVKAVGIAAITLALAGAATSAQRPAAAGDGLPGQPAPEIAFDAADILKTPLDRQLGEIAGVAVNRAGHIFVFQRGNVSGPAYGAAAAQLLEYDPNGHLLREIGKNLYAWSYAHAVKIDPQGNIWAADKGSDVVVRFTPEGRVSMVVGRKSEASDESARPLRRANPPLPPVEGQFRQVTDMTWDSKGNTYISDGYINARIAKLGPDGQWLKSWGTPGPGPGQLNTPHAIASDAQDRIYVADRGNRRIQVFDTEGNVLRIIQIDVPAPPNAPLAIGLPVLPPGEGPPPDARGYNPFANTFMAGSPWAICITPAAPGQQQYLYAADANPGRIYKLTLDGKVLGWLGGSGKRLKQFGWIHEMACGSENELYVGELLNWRMQKLTLHPTPAER